jgi:hypothetical protein
MEEQFIFFVQNVLSKSKKVERNRISTSDINFDLQRYGSIIAKK